MRTLITIVMLLVTTPLFAQSYAFKVIDASGGPVANAVIALGTPGPVRHGTAVMDQRHKQFVPFVLPITAGTRVSFPNSDQIRHQVYSFSPSHPFEIKLYRGRPPHPIEFDKTGIVVLGCNIHDNMLAYIYVTRRPVFGKTNRAGELTLESGASVHTIEVWHPALSIDAQKQLSVSLKRLERDGRRYVIPLHIPEQPANPQAVSLMPANRFQKFLQH